MYPEFIIIIIIIIIIIVILTLILFTSSLENEQQLGSHCANHIYPYTWWPQSVDRTRHSVSCCIMESSFICLLLCRENCYSLGINVSKVTKIR